MPEIGHDDADIELLYEVRDALRQIVEGPMA